MVLLDENSVKLLGNDDNDCRFGFVALGMVLGFGAESGAQIQKQSHSRATG